MSYHDTNHSKLSNCLITISKCDSNWSSPAKVIQLHLENQPIRSLLSQHKIRPSNAPPKSTPLSSHFQSHRTNATIQLQPNLSSTMNISPQELCNIVLGKLTPDERAAAQGTFSGPSLPFGYDNAVPTNPINVWFQGNITSNQQKMIIQHNDISALVLFYNGRFQVISKPNAQMDMATRDEFIVGHFGDALNAIIPVAISTLDITSDFLGLLPVMMQTTASLVTSSQADRKSPNPF